jgi:hypothetical protein
MQKERMTMADIRNIAALTAYERDQMLDFLLFHMSMELRERLMFALPRQYNLVVGQDVMIVRRASDVLGVNEAFALATQPDRCPAEDAGAVKKARP